MEDAAGAVGGHRPPSAAKPGLVGLASGQGPRITCLASHALHELLHGTAMRIGPGRRERGG